MNPLFVLACSAQKTTALKAGGAVAARDAYAGRAFLAARHWMEKIGAKWCILSGWYGFLWPDTVIANYDVKMEPVGPDTVWDEAFGAIKQKQYGRLRSAERVIVLGSRVYVSAAEWLLGRTVEAPLKGLGIGKQYQVLSRGQFLDLTKSAA